MSRTPDDLVRAEVCHCASWLVSTLAAGYGAVVTHVDANGRRSTNGGDLADMIEQAFELTCPIDDWEEAAIQAGYSVAHGGPYIRDPHGNYISDSDGTVDPTADDAWRTICELADIESYQREVFEHWIVTDWFANKLIEQGEKVDKDFAGMCIWARTTSGQGIASDSVIERIAAEINAA